MALTAPTTHDVPPGDELDDILNGIVDGKDLFDTSDIQPTTKSQDEQRNSSKKDTLGIEEEIKLVKQRQPIPKLDENLILCAAGIPRLRTISKERLRFKGKGHEYGDIGRMLNMYQLWLDDLYPRAKFADGLAIIEKLGHTKRMQYMRKEWIDEGKPKDTTEIDPDEEDATSPFAAQQIEDGMEGVMSHQAADTESAGEETLRGSRQEQNSGIDSAPEEPDEDELDALLAETAKPEAALTSAPPTLRTADDHDMFADDMEAFEELGGIW